MGTNKQDRSDTLTSDNTKYSPPSAWSNVGIEELFNLDGRPTLVVDLASRDDSGKLCPQVIFQNPIFTANYSQETIVWKDAFRESQRFQEWACSITNYPKLSPSSQSYAYCDLSWTTFILRERWRIITGSLPSSKNPQRLEAAEDHSEHRVASANGAQPVEPASSVLSQSPSHDWTAHSPPTVLTPYLKFLRAWNWSTTPLGPIESWSPQLRLMANLICTNPRPVVMFWGPR